MQRLAIDLLRIGFRKIPLLLALTLAFSTGIPGVTDVRSTLPLPSTAAYAETSTNSSDTSSFRKFYGDLRKDSSRKALGNPDAPVTVTEYVDLQCPYCRRFNRNTVPKILRHHVRTGEVYYRVRHFPLDTHEQAKPLANMAECAAEQEAFFQFKYLLFAKKGPETTRELVRRLDLENPRKFTDCVRRNKFMEKVEEEKREGKSRGVSSTPTIFVEDQKLEGAHPYETVRESIKRQQEQ